MMNEIEQIKRIRTALESNDNKLGNFSDPNYTLGVISSIVDYKWKH